MNWKNRQMFSDREHGIVSGLSPINMVNGGSVPMPGYEDGGTVGQALREGFTEPMQNIAQTLGAGVAGATAGSLLGPALFEGDEKPSINDEVAELATKMGISIPQARAMVLNRMIKQRGLTLSPDIVNQFAVGLISLHDALAQALGPPKPIPGMQGGGLAMDLFEEGDQEINEALNMMSGSVSPPLSDIGPTAPTGPMLEETIDEETAIMDQGYGEYQVELQSLKETFKDEIRSYVAQAGTTDLGKYLKNMNITYTNELDKLKQKYNVEIEDPNDKLLTSDFIEEIMSAVNPQEITQIPEMNGGGIVESIKTKEDLAKYGIPLTIDVWLPMSKSQKEAWLYSEVAKQAMGAGKGALDTNRLDQLLKDRKALARQIGEAARSSHSSYLPRILHHGAAKSVGELAEAGAMDKILADQIATEGALLGSGGTTGRFKEPADVTSAKILGVDEDLYDTSSMFTARVKKLEAEFANYPDEQAIIEFADQGELPPYNTYRRKKLMGSTPVDWITFYRASKAQIKDLPDKPTDREAYVEALLQILEDWKALPNA
jgi:hypothetical protein